MIRVENIESRLFLIGGLLVTIGTVLAGLLFGPRYALSFAAGGLLSAINLTLLRRTVNSALLRRPVRSGWRVAVAYILRLLLIPLCLYAMMRLFFFGIIAAIAGFAAFSCSVLIEGILEAFRSS